MRRLFLLFALSVFSSFLFAQQRFEGRLVVGLNASQIQGDDLAGYNKAGLRAGLGVSAVLGERTSLGLDMLFSQRGSSSPITRSNNQPRRLVQLNYVELPVLFSLADWWDDDESFYHLLFQAGLVYSRLINSKVEFFPPFETEKENFAQNDLSFSVGVAYYTNLHWGFSARYSRSVFLLYNNKKHLNDNGAPIYASSMRAYFISFELQYKF